MSSPSAPLSDGKPPTTPGAASPAAPSPSGPKVAEIPKTSIASTDLVDETHWSFWWEYNKEPFLDLKRAVRDGGPGSGDDSFYLGQPVSGSATRDLAPTPWQVREQILPTLLAAIENDQPSVIRRQLLLALAKVSEAPADGETAIDLDMNIGAALTDKSLEVAETAIVALGVNGDIEATEKLAHILHGCSVGTDLIGGGRVSDRRRAMAAYALGLVAARTRNEDVRRFIVHHVVWTLENNTGSRPDLGVACLAAIGLSPLPFTGVEPSDYAPGGASDSREAQLDRLLSLFEDGDLRDTERAHVPIALARLVQGTSPAWRERVADSLIASMSRRARSPREVHQSVALALGQIGDADDDPIDRRIRATLDRTVRDGDRSTRFFALIGLAQVGSRMGDGKGEPLGATPDVRRTLLKHLAKGKSGSKPWAGLALGVLGHGLRQSGVTPSEDVSRALEFELRSNKTPSEIGAFAIAAGLRRDGHLRRLIEARLDDFRGHDRARGYMAIGLGLLDARAASERLFELMDESENRPWVLGRAAEALALLDHGTLPSDLTTRLGEAKSLQTQSTLLSALGRTGDTRCVSALVEFIEKGEATDFARSFSVMALGMIADKEDLPWRSLLTTGANYRASTETFAAQSSTGILDMP